MSVLLTQIDYDNRKLYILEEVLGLPEKGKNYTPHNPRNFNLKKHMDICPSMNFLS